jgi:methyl-accepting chemotaxis protein
MQFKSIKLKIALLSGISVFAAAGAVVGFSIYSASSSRQFVTDKVSNLTVKLTEDNIARLAQYQSDEIRATLDRAFDSARGMARMFEVAASNEAASAITAALRRATFNGILLNTLKDNPGFNGTYSAWEPNALDGMDDQYRNKKEAGSDATGRFLPYWTRDVDGKIAIQPLVEYDSKALHENGVMKGGWYIGPATNGDESILDPLPYIVQGKNVVLATMSVPIHVNGKFVGVAGADFNLAFVQKLAEQVKASIYGGKASVDIVSNMGLVVASSEHPDMIGKAFTTTEGDAKKILPLVQKGESTVLASNKDFSALAAIQIGRSKTPWAVLISVPKEVALADATKLDNDMLARSTSDIWTQLLAGILIAMGGITVMWFVARSIAAPIGQMTEAMDNLANGKLDTDVPGVGREDEIGGMASAVEIFRSNAIKTRELEAETEAQRSEVEVNRQRAAENDRQIAERTGFATSSLAEGLRHLANGNLGFQLDKPFATEFETLRSDFNLAVSQLASTLAAVAQATQSIDDGSQEISSSANDLSRRTEHQAASLEETAAALDEITTNVASSSTRAEEARKVALQANQNAAQSGVIVNNAIEAMHKIELASQQITNIIGVIDEIAFQTNLLALNAGVEAARAGDAGKGFAVVAQEVRELAQRSAQASREIRGLISSSANEVENGVKLVGETGKALKTIEAFVNNINQHMEAIATSSREQSLGLAEVNTAVNQMDEVTQQNAAMVEEATAASTTLAEEAMKLRELISQFSFDQHGEQDQSSQLRSAATAMANARYARVRRA